MVTRSVAERRSSESIKQQRSMSITVRGGKHRRAGRKVMGLMLLTGVAEAKAVGGTAKGEQPTVVLYGADEALEELADVLFDGKPLHRGEELDDEIEETLGEADDEALPGCARLGGVWVGMWDMAVGGLGGVLRCDGHVGVGARRGRKEG